MLWNTTAGGTTHSRVSTSSYPKEEGNLEHCLPTTTLEAKSDQNRHSNAGFNRHSSKNSSWVINHQKGINLARKKQPEEVVPFPTRPKSFFHNSEIPEGRGMRDIGHKKLCSAHVYLTDKGWMRNLSHHAREASLFLETWVYPPSAGDA